MKAFEVAIERGTQKGFSDPRSQEVLIRAMGEAARGSILSGTDGLQGVSAFLTGGAHGDVTTSQAEARSGVLKGLDHLSANNQFFSQVNVASAKGRLGASGSNMQLAGLAGASETELLAGGQQFDDLGIDKKTRMAAFKDRIHSKVAAFSNMDPELKKALEDANGDLSQVDSKLIRRTLRRTKTFGSDEAASAATEMFKSVDSLGDMTSAGSGKKLKQYTDGLAIMSISTEERTKAALIGKEVADAMMKIYKEMDVEKMVKKQAEDEKEGKNFDFRAGKMFVVEIIKSIDATDKTPQHGREPTTK